MPDDQLTEKVHCFFSSKNPLSVAHKTPAEVNSYLLNGVPGGQLSKKVRRFFSSKNPLLFAFKASAKVKKLREELDTLSTNHKNFGFSELYKPVKGRVETYSYVYEHNIIGRDADKKEIVDLLLKDDSDKDISFVTVVGIGGLGKTALAQLVFSDHRIKAAFKDEMYWVCVSFNFDTKDILSKILKKKQRTFEDLYSKVQKQIEGKRYMLVLDDVWYEGGIKWDELRDFLKLGGKGSRILVTSRSQKVATAIGNYPMHKLQGLSEKDSWELFRKISLGAQEDEFIAGFDEIGRDIVKKMC
ncbi:putative disease resistance protein RGA3 [Chenopodium quinoa]|uniref:putative disease resistance protein RGA3 n=1 Tax=Chenopodium quinoa TaxID=63459 RepID=UPI000B783020|nr:putative disease resistance protein RGA3 [Chenopodium quinoa]XP_021757065.1 putative disease resistance protein RGA3 [Chenopodium quinoa]XP_021757066.1 putative disease resistance protein RGA3 [Chenopodium quinoa]